MARVKVTVPDSFTFSSIIPVRITDLNYGNHVGNDSVLSLIHEARVQFLKHHQLTELNFGGVGLIMADVAIEFKAELFYGDVLKVYVAANDFSAVGFDLVYKLVKNEEETLVATAKTGMVCFDYEKKKVAKVPELALKQLQ
ncbi:thioesterase family protein [Chitinophagaceae bacterium LB-8]|uniref:Thioesterase family protein n=1 Tax=Paraflavisolibacter caeni TaxID=2982496 RepID=A0A9X3B7M7_9BACT|nr:thioesterase family protein [Paraflavisolibacter caeni]MCU7548646.1 thioesterase family protein [Paraflavisolibacter caeni]